ncbi:hypothetical protein SUGI_0336530 [Cryptomeria japonica]|uniref:chaperone protein dnaJ 49 n=1 Tax=Cryptomeria japonica TaxID=3369 RepID=UPI002408E027|nr:chaperone protein dnaJ 49 [Cryptomeria japonica]GLJ18842.1 hypothetical protein SUGI_0336530 [Cryptomeria japonica]
MSLFGRRIKSFCIFPAEYFTSVNSVCKKNSMDDPDMNYTEDQVEAVRKISGTQDYYIILGVDKNSSVHEIRKAYRKLSLKVHPDKNKAPGAEEAFKALSNAFNSLSNAQHRSKLKYQEEEEDGNSSDDEFQFQFQYNRHIIFRSLGGFKLLVLLLQILPMFLLFFVSYFPFLEPNYALQRNGPYQFSKLTKAHGVPFFVKIDYFDKEFPPESSVRVGLEIQVETAYKKLLRHYCHIETQRCEWGLAFQTPHCDKLEQF